jgi:hyperosmotically inducible protein
MRYLSLALMAIALTGCVESTDERPLPMGDSPKAGSATTAPSSTTMSGSEAPRPDNTAVNQRDRDSAAKTPIDQDENSEDIQFTADIRKQILSTEGMSVNARNVKIITSQGKVTLRGPVSDDAEKAKVEKIAGDVVGAENVTSELEIAK